MLGPPPNSQCDTWSETKTVREAIAVRMTAARLQLSRALISLGVVSNRRIYAFFVASRVASENVGGVLFFCFQITRLA
jgi:hypothetical protein